MEDDIFWDKFHELAKKTKEVSVKQTAKTHVREQLNDLLSLKGKFHLSSIDEIVCVQYDKNNITKKELLMTLDQIKKQLKPVCALNVDVDDGNILFAVPFSGIILKQIISKIPVKEIQITLSFRKDGRNRNN